MFILILLPFVPIILGSILMLLPYLLPLLAIILVPAIALMNILILFLTLRRIYRFLEHYASSFMTRTSPFLLIALETMVFLFLCAVFFAFVKICFQEARSR